MTHGVAIIGGGWVAGEYVKAFRDDPRTTVTGIHTRTPGRGDRLLRDHGVDAREYARLEDVLEDERVEIVVSATPPDVRAEHVCAAARAGRHVMIEKPVALSLEEVRAIRDAVATAGVRSTTSFVLRWNPQVLTVKQLILDGVLGDLVYGEAGYWHPIQPRRGSDSTDGDWRYGREMDVTAFASGGCHAVDMLRYLIGDVVEVTAFAGTPKTGQPFEFEPAVVATLRFANGGIGTVSALLEGDTPYVFTTRLIGTEGSIQDNRVYSSRRYPGATDYWSFPTVPPSSGDVRHHPFAAEVADFIDCIEAGVESHASIHDTWKSMATCFAIDESVAAGGTPVQVSAV